MLHGLWNWMNCNKAWGDFPRTLKASVALSLTEKSFVVYCCWRAPLAWWFEMGHRKNSSRSRGGPKVFSRLRNRATFRFVFPLDGSRGFGVMSNCLNSVRVKPGCLLSSRLNWRVHVSSAFLRTCTLSPSLLTQVNSQRLGGMEVLLLAFNV